MTKTQDELYQLALSKMAIPTCECLLDGDENSSFTTKDNNKKETQHDSNRTSRTRAILAEAQNKIP